MAPPPLDSGHHLAYEGSALGWLQGGDTKETATITDGTPTPEAANDTGTYQITPDADGLFAVMPPDQLRDALMNLTGFERSALENYLMLQTKTYEARVMHDRATQTMRRETRSEAATTLGIAYVAAYTKKVTPIIEKTTQVFDQYRDGRNTALAMLRRVPHAYRFAQMLGVTRSPRKSAALLHELRNSQPVSVVSLTNLGKIIPFIPSTTAARPAHDTRDTASKKTGMLRIEQAVRQLVTAFDTGVPIDWNGEHQMQLAGEKYYQVPTPAEQIKEQPIHPTHDRQPSVASVGTDTPSSIRTLFHLVSKLAPSIDPQDNADLVADPADRLQRTDNHYEMLGGLHQAWPTLKVDPADQPIVSRQPKNIPHTPATPLQKWYGLSGNYRTPADIARSPRGPHLYTYPYERLQTTDPAKATPLVDKLGRGIKSGLRILAVAASLLMPAQKVALDHTPPVKQAHTATAEIAPKDPAETLEHAYNRLATIVPPHILSEARQRIYMDLQHDPTMQTIMREMQELRRIHTDQAATRRHELALQKQQLEQQADAEYASIIRTANERLTPVSEADRMQLAKTFQHELQAVAPTLPVGGYAVVISKTSQMAITAQKVETPHGVQMVVTSVLPTGSLDAKTKTGTYIVSEIAYGTKVAGNNPAAERQKMADKRQARINALSDNPNRSRAERRELSRLWMETAFTDAANKLNHGRYAIGSGTTPHSAAKITITATASTGARITLSSANNADTRIGTLEGIYLAGLAQNNAYVQVTNTPLPSKKPAPEPQRSTPRMLLASVQ